MNYLDQFQQLSEQRKRIDDLVTNLNLDYINKIKGRFVNEKDPYMQAEVSFSFRMRALGFHLGAMLTYLESIPQRLQDLHYESRKAGLSPMSLYIGEEFAIDVLHLFKSVLFNLVSFIDYTGTLVCCCFEQQNIQKWDGLKSACDSKENLLSRLKLSSSVKLFEKELVNRIYKLRSVVIHNRNIWVNINTKWDLMNSKYEVTILAPQAEVKKFSELSI
ncbi:hypothetical protein [Spirosoma endophyticum]|uniref:Cthe-2314-like HEPN domain-containing protein n=1 Tax=Spirosoma endophyticum TaxID=662367 RepID=A0A1I1RPI3_9BACT|nr:hypothetical protein [Spirosoma endophyticum]SFD36185.1 hypothetical protein SAMN05216167_104490 [Spirosoma endophyticum]